MENIASIIEDIVAFADPFTEPKNRKHQGKTRITFFRNGRELQYDLNPESGGIAAIHRKRTYPDIKSLLASDEFANIERFAETQRRFFEKKQVSNTIATEIRFGDKAVTVEEVTRQFQNNTGKTQLILLDGPAGVGKTFQVEQMSQIQAGKCRDGSVEPPVLHISSRGRRLSNFRDVLAATTQDIGASFTARHVPILVRHSLLVAAVDGFDELVDADGYEDAWLALKEFIDEIRGGGTVVLAARDTFVEEQELLTRIQRADQSITLSMGRVESIHKEAAKEWLSKAPHWKISDIESSVTDDILYEGSYALRPFFLRVLKDAKGWDDVLQSGPRTFLITNLVWREAVLIAQQLGGTTAEVIAPALILLFQEIALEMAARETDSIEIDHLAFLTNYCFDGVLDEISIRKLSHKAGSFSLLESSWANNKRRFPHSEIQHYFLGAALIKSLENRTIPMVLRRSTLSGQHLDVFAEVFSNDEIKAKKASEFLSTAVNSEISADGLLTNGGAILVLAFSLGLLDRLDFISAFDAVFAGDSPKGFFSNSNVSRLEILGSDISEVVFDSVDVGTLVVDDSTIFGLSRPNIEILEIRQGVKASLVRDKNHIDAFMAAHLKSNEGAYAASQLIGLLDRVVRRAIRYFYLREQDDDGAFLLKDNNWPKVRAVLEESNRIEVKKAKSMHGRPSPLLRITNPRKLLDYKDPETVEIFKKLLQLEKGAA